MQTHTYKKDNKDQKLTNKMELMKRNIIQVYQVNKIQEKFVKCIFCNSIQKRLFKTKPSNPSTFRR